MKNRVLSVLLALVILLTLLPTAALADNIASGTDWVLDAGGKLTISSDAGMADWPSSGTTHKGSVTSVAIQSGVTSIGGSAFNGCTTLASITIPESVTSIGNFAFRGCTALTNITVPENVTSIGDYAFWNCTALTSITIPENAKVTTIGTSAFSDCSKLTSIMIPKNVASIGNSAFNSCTSLASITIPESVTSIGSSAFYYCTSLASITIPESVTSIGNSAFYYCTALESVTIPENARVTSIGEKVFSLCVSLTSITIPESVTSIGSSAFKNCEALASITIPKSVTSIGSSAFSTCRALTTVTMLPETPPTVGEGVFSSCKFFKEQTTGIHVPEGTEQAYKTVWQAWADYITDGTQKSDHNHPVCGNDCGHEGPHEVVPWKALDQTSFTGGGNGAPKPGSGVTLDGSTYKLATGHYYLAGSVNLDKKIYINSSTVDLCLNGHTLTSEIVANSGNQNAIEVSNDATLNLCDCVGSGKITSNANALYTLEIKDGATSIANLYGGTVDSPTGTCVETRGNLVLDGATLTADMNYVIDAQPNNGSVTIKSGTVKGGGMSSVEMSSSNAMFTMTGGTVTNTGSGKGVYVNQGGGAISGGTIRSENGAGVFLSGNSLTLSGAPVITGGEAGITLHNDSTITVGDNLTGTYTVFRDNWKATQAPHNQYEITENKPYAFTTAASADHSGHFTAAAQMTGIAVRNSGTGNSQQVQLYMPHNWSSGWTTSETHHWHICHNSAEGNCTITDYATCDEAGAAYGTHEWSYETNPTQHRQKCTVCGYTENSWTPHTWTDDHDVDCNVCGYERSVPLYGTVTVTGTPKLGVQLTAAVTGAPEGVTLQYAWTAAGSDVVLGTASTYTPTANHVGKILTVTVTTTDDHRYTGSIFAVTAAVAKGDQAAPVGIFTVTDAAYGQSTGTIAITGDAAKLEYRLKPMDGSDPAWSDAASRNELAIGTYEFRYKETATHNASPATLVQVRTLTAEAKTLSIAPGIAHGTVTKRRDKVNPGDTVTLAVQPDPGYHLTGIAANYNDGGSKTITPTVNPDNAAQYTFTMPNADVTVTATFSPDPGKTDGVVEVVGDTPQVSVDTNILKEMAGTPTANQTITVKLVVEKQDAPEDKPEIELVLAAGTKNDVLYLDLSLLKITETTGGGASKPEPIPNAARVLAIVVPYDFTGKQRVTVYRCHSGKAEALTEASTQADGTFALDKGNGTVTIYASKFSTYAIGYTAAGQAATYTLTVNGGTGSGSYAADTIVKISATVPSGQRFTGWTGAVVANSGSASTTLVMPAQNTTVTANFQNISNGGGGSGGSDPTTYPVETPGADGGKVTASPKNASSGTTVTLTLTPEEGYKAGRVTVTDGNGKPIVVTAIGDRKYTFIMPSGKVTVTGVFIKIADGYQDCPRDSTCPIWPYTDANPKAWYHDGIHYCIENGLMCGYGNSLFGPNDNLSRAQFAQILYNREDRPVVNCLLQYNDVADGAWYAEAVRWATSKGVVVGYGNGLFGPDDNITREQLAVMLWRYVGSTAVTGKELPFTDADEASGYALEALRWAADNGIVNGYGDGRLDPTGLATRAQTAAMIMRFCTRK